MLRVTNERLEAPKDRSRAEGAALTGSPPFWWRFLWRNLWFLHRIFSRWRMNCQTSHSFQRTGICHPSLRRPHTAPPGYLRGEKNPEWPIVMHQLASVRVVYKALAVWCSAPDGGSYLENALLLSLILYLTGVHNPFRSTGFLHLRPICAIIPPRPSSLPPPQHPQPTETSKAWIQPPCPEPEK